MKLIAIVLCLSFLYWQKRLLSPVALKVAYLYLDKVSKYFDESSSPKSIQLFLTLLLPLTIVFLVSVAIASIGNDGSALIMIFSGAWSLQFFLFSAFLLLFLISPGALSVSQSNENNEANKPIEEAIKKYLHGFFGPIFWFVLLGPLMVFFYFLLSVITEHYKNKDPQDRTENKILELLNFPVVVALCFTFALSGNFDSALKKINERLTSTKVNLLACFREDLLCEIADSSSSEKSLNVESYVTTLARRALFIWLVIISLMTLFGWAL
jgi:sorbitol-specific phosphotransferase system component IIC